MVAQPNPIESLLGAEWLVRVQRMMATGIFRTFGIGQEVKLLSIDTLDDAMGEGNLRFWDSSHFFLHQRVFSNETVLAFDADVLACTIVLCTCSAQ